MVLVDGFDERFRQRGLLYPGDTHAHVVLSHHLGIFRTCRLAPGHMFPQIHPFQQRGHRIIREHVSLHSTRTCRDNRRVHFSGGNVLPHEGRAFFAAQRSVGSTLDNPELIGDCGKGVQVYGFSDTASRANINTNLLIHKPYLPTVH